MCVVYFKLSFICACPSFLLLLLSFSNSALEFMATVRVSLSPSDDDVVVQNGGYDGNWMFGVCRPGIDLNNGEDFLDGDDTWLMWQNNNPDWALSCSTCAGTGMTLDPKPKLPAGSRIGLLLDLDNGGTLTMYLEGKPCGTIAAGLVGPLLPCISAGFKGKVVKIHGGLAPPQ